MKISDDGLELLKTSEGWRDHVYLDQAGKPTIGYGHLLRHSELRAYQGVRISEEEGARLLAEDVRWAEEAVISLVKVPLTQKQFDVLVDFTFNVGKASLKSSTLLRLLNSGDYDSVPAQLLRWDKVTDPASGKKVRSEGLANRRKREADLWRASSGPT